MCKKPKAPKVEQPDPSPQLIIAGDEQSGGGAAKRRKSGIRLDLLGSANQRTGLTIPGG